MSLTLPCSSSLRASLEASSRGGMIENERIARLGALVETIGPRSERRALKPDLASVPDILSRERR